MQVLIDGNLKKPTCPTSNEKGECPKCGCTDHEPIYGCGSGYGIGSYSICCECDTVLDFVPDQQSIEDDE